MPNCVHCNRDYGSVRRGLCRPCFNDPGIRGLYPRLPGGPKQPGTLDTSRMTEAELNAFVAAQLNGPLPEWWWSERAEEALPIRKPRIKLVNPRVKKGLPGSRH